MDLAGLLVNIGVFIASAVAAWVAWEQARSSQRARTAAEAAETRTIEAREAAVKAQNSAADALKEANRIANEAKQVVEGAEARKLEHHNVRWEPVWHSREGKWILANRGPDTARDVELSVFNPYHGHMPVERAAEVSPEHGLSVVFKEFINQGGFPRVTWSVAWRTPLGALREAKGDWDH